VRAQLCEFFAWQAKVARVRRKGNPQIPNLRKTPA
jgi:hypothetical protein